MFQLPEPVVARAEHQFGVLGRVQLLRWLTEDQVDGLVRSGVFLPIERGAYRVAGGATMPEQAAMAAVIRARPGAVITGPLVLALLGVDGFTRSDPFEVLTAPGRRLRGVTFRHRANPTPTTPTAQFRGLPIARPTACLVDAHRWVSVIGDRRLRLGTDAARWKKLTTDEKLVARARHLGRSDPGGGRILAMADSGDLKCESQGERDLGALLRRFKPPPEAQVWVTPKRRVDWYWRSLRLALEYLGTVDHATVAGRLADAQRDEELRQVGVRTVPVTATDLRDPDALLPTVAAALTVRAAQLGHAAPTLAARPVAAVQPR